MKRHYRPIRILLVGIVIACAVGDVQGQDPSNRSGGRDRGRRRWNEPIGKNDGAVRTAFQDAVAAAAAATVRIRGDNEDIALGTIVEADGYLVTKASVLKGKLTCRFKDGSEKEATLMAQDTSNDLALLRVQGGTLSAVVWRDGEPPSPGSLVASTAPSDQPLAIGAVSTATRRVGGSMRLVRPKAWLGIALGMGDSSCAIERVDRDSPAEQSGLQAADVVKQIDGVAVKSAEEIISTVGRHHPGDTIKLAIHRNDGDKEISVDLARPPESLAPEDQWGGGPFSDRRWGFPSVFAHDTPINPKDCGGPVVDTDGRVVGVNIARPLRVVTYALPASSVKLLVADLKQKSLRTTKQ